MLVPKATYCEEQSIKKMLNFGCYSGVFVPARFFVRLDFIRKSKLALALANW